MRVDTSISSEHNAMAASTAAVAAVAPSAPIEDADVASTAGDSGTQSGVRVTLSATGLARSGEDKNSDIDEADLPATIKQLLKLIRELKAQLAEKMAELQALMAHHDADDEAGMAKSQALQAQIVTLTGALSTASAQLVKAMRDESLTDVQSATVASLLAV